MLSVKSLSKFKVCYRCFSSCRILSQLCIKEEIRQAIFDKQAVVALESAIITHGMKYPENLKTATTVQNVIRDQGAIPATIAVLSGQVKVGLTDKELEELSSNSKSTLKISRRDYPYVISQMLSGGTTVSGTLLIAHKVGIPIFVTGGIGGVHREGESTMDISADLTELGKTPVAVISSGVKSILDIEKTLEYLETEGVAVATYGLRKEFPAFYCRKSHFESPYNLTSDIEAAKFIQIIFDLKMNSGILIGVPIPEEFSLNESDMSSAIEEGLKKAKKENIKGKALTPFLLNEISNITEGKSLEANIALIKNNALVGAKIAMELAKLRRIREDNVKFSNGWFPPSSITTDSANGESHPKVVVIGASNLDFIINITDDYFRMDGRTVRGRISQAGGGVGRNIADALGKLDVNTFLVTAVGDEEFGDFVARKTIPHLESKGILRVPNASTGTCMVLCDHTGECLLVVGDMDIHRKITIDQIKKHERRMAESSLLVLDGNLLEETLEYLLRFSHDNSVPVWYEPTDYYKAHKPFKEKKHLLPKFISPNYQEFLKIYETIYPNERKNDNPNKIDDCIAKGIELIDFIDNIIITLGKEGVLVIRRGKSDDSFFGNGRYIKPKGEVSSRLYKHEIIPQECVANVSGAGDCFASGFIAAMIRGMSEKICVETGLKCSTDSLKCEKPVPECFTSNLSSRINYSKRFLTKEDNNKHASPDKNVEKI